LATAKEAIGHVRKFIRRYPGALIFDHNVSPAPALNADYHGAFRMAERVLHKVAHRQCKQYGVERRDLLHIAFHLHPISFDRHVGQDAADQFPWAAFNKVRSSVCRFHGRQVEQLSHKPRGTIHTRRDLPECVLMHLTIMAGERHLSLRFETCQWGLELMCCKSCEALLALARFLNAPEEPVERMNGRRNLLR